MKMLLLGRVGVVASVLFSAIAPIPADAREPAASGDTSLELPKRRPGLWRIATIWSEIGMQTNDVCIEEGDSIIGAPDNRCATPALTRGNDQFIVTIECGAGDAREITSILFTGDFRSWYRAQSRMTTRASHSGFTVEAKFLDQSCARNEPR